MSDTYLNVFVNCPFDGAYRASFEALLFTITASGYRVRCALEAEDSGDIRFDKLCRLIGESDRTIHDLSRIEVGENELPRFNMPFELGLALGAKRFGGKRQKAKSALIMVAEPYRLPAYLSDLGGNDPVIHHRDPLHVIKVVRRFLHASPSGEPLPGQHMFIEIFERFKHDLPGIAAARRVRHEEIHPYEDYRAYLWFLSEFVRRLQTA